MANSSIFTSGRRGWVQTGGLPLEPLHKEMRAELDQVHGVTYLGSACFKLFDDAGRQVGIMQFQGPAQDRTDAAVAEALERIAAGIERPADIAAGDAVVRSLDMTNPEDRALIERATASPLDGVRFPDEPPPIDLPDYVPSNAPENRSMGSYVDLTALRREPPVKARFVPLSELDEPEEAEGSRRIMLGLAGALVVGFLVWLAVAYFLSNLKDWF